MSKRKRRATPALPLMMLELTMASWETIGRRTLLMARGACSAQEYTRMVQEKATAMHRSATVLARSRRPKASAVLAPWHAKATANARRLRSK